MLQNRPEFQTTNTSTLQIQEDIENFEQALHLYFKQIFHALFKLEAELDNADSDNGSKIHAYTFWQFTKLPKLVSDRLFDSFEQDGLWGLEEFIQCFKMLCTGTLQDKVSLVFAMMDTKNREYITRQDCKTMLTHTLGYPRKKSYQQICSSQENIVRILNKYFKHPSSFIKLVDYERMGRDNEIQNEILNFLLKKLKIEQKVLNFWKAHPNIFPASSTSMTLRSRKESIAVIASLLQDLGSSSEKECGMQEEPNIQYEGMMYRMIEGKGLRGYYYKLINSELYVYRSKSDSFFKCIIYLGFQDNVRPRKSNIETKSQSEVFSLELLQPDRTREFYHLSQESCEEWRKALLKAIGKENRIEQDYELGKFIGRGKFGEVRCVINKSTKEEYAVKTIRKLDLERDEYKTIRLEAQIQQMCNHPNLLGLIAYYEDYENIYLVQEYMKGGTLKKYLHSHKSKLNHLEVRGIAHQLCMALHYLHSFNIIHRDLKPENILLTGLSTEYYDQATKKTYTVPEVKLADFGLSTIMSKQCSEPYGTMCYAAPQIFIGEPYSYAIDVYSLGSVLYQLLSGRVPFYSAYQKEFIKKIMYEEPVFYEQSFCRTPTDLIQILNQMLRKSPLNRITLKELLCSSTILKNLKEVRQIRQTCTLVSEFRDMTSS